MISLAEASPNTKDLLVLVFILRMCLQFLLINNIIKICFMIKRIINWFKNYKYRNLIYNINGDHIEIIGLENKYVKSISIPKEINGYPVQYIRQGIFAFWMLEYINGEKIKNRYHIINNRFIFKLGDSIIYNIKYQIGNDYYVCYHYYEFSEYSYLINDMEYVSNLRV